MPPKISKYVIDLKSDVQKLLTKRFVLRNEVNSLVYIISNLDVDQPNVCRFTNVKNELSAKLAELRKANSDCLLVI